MSFHPQGVRIPTFSKLLKYFFEMILPVLSDLCYDLNWPIYSCFLIGLCTFSIFTCKKWDFQLFQIYVIKILLQDDSNRTSRFILRFKMAYLQWFSDWRLYVFHYFIWSEWDFQLYKPMSLRYFFQTILGVVQYISYNLKSPYRIVMVKK